MVVSRAMILGCVQLAHKLTVLSKEGCHLCERAIDTLLELSTSYVFDLEVVDISSDETLFKKYFLRIPVICLDGRDIFDAEQLALPNDCRRNLEDLVKSLR
jgi:glutaredoxin